MNRGLKLALTASRVVEVVRVAGVSPMNRGLKPIHALRVRGRPRRLQEFPR